MRFGIVPAHGPRLLKETIEQTQLCETLGFDSVWIEEHHGDGNYWPTPLLALSALSSHTESIFLGTNILILPLYDPVHIAEQLAILDVITGGRIIFGTSIGESSKDFAMFRVQPGRRGHLFEEQIQVIRKLWNEDVIDFNGEFFQYNHIGIPVRPAQSGGPSIWIGGWGPRQIERAAIYGDAWFPGPVSDLQGVVQRLATYQEHLVALGKDLSIRAHPLTRDIVLAKTKKKALELAEEELFSAYKQDYLDGEHPLVGKESGSHFKDFQDFAKDRLIIGDPDTVIAETIKVIKTTSTDHLILRAKLPGIEVSQITKTIQLLGKEIIPEIRRLID